MGRACEKRDRGGRVAATGIAPGDAWFADQDADGNLRSNPLTAAAGDMLRYAAEVGFSPAARARIAADGG
jgi:phage terminase small subunit